MLWGWTDTVKDNYPCVPPDFSSKCLEWSHVEVLFSVLNKLIPAIGDLLFTQAWNLRLGTNNLPPADLYMLAEQRGINADMLPVIVEEDTWNYQTTRNGAPASGPSMVRRVLRVGVRLGTTTASCVCLVLDVRLVCVPLRGRCAVCSFAACGRLLACSRRLTTN